MQLKILIKIITYNFLCYVYNIYRYSSQIIRVSKILLIFINYNKQVKTYLKIDMYKTIIHNHNILIKKLRNHYIKLY